MKSLILLLLSFVSLSFAQRSNDPYLAAAWMFDKNLDSKIYNSKLGYNDGCFDPEITDRVTGKRGRAIEFHGTLGKGQISIQQKVEFECVDFTIGMWIKPRVFQNWNSTALDFSNFDSGIIIAQHKNWGNEYRIKIIGVYDLHEKTKPKDIIKLPANRWSHLTFIRKGVKGYWYLNGRIRSKITIGNQKPIKTGSDWVYIGGSRWSMWREFNGIIDEVFVIRKALNPESIREIMKRGFQRAYNVRKDPRKNATLWGIIKQQ